jgi:DNA (cytosine-5)-methyltransferase 1
MGTLYGLALCAGVGGLELGFDLAFGPASIECWVEHDPKKARVLQARMQDGIFADAPIWDDLRTFNGREWRGIDFLAAGWPCRPFSTASRGRATAPDLWGSVRQVVAQSRPRLVALENVPRAPWASVGNSLERLGYSVAHCVACPSTLGAPHRRPRGYLLAYSDREGEPRRALDAEMQKWPAYLRWQTEVQGTTPEVWEYLMGWPPGWTDYEPAATEWSRWRQRMLSELWRLEQGL